VVHLVVYGERTVGGRDAFWAGSVCPFGPGLYALFGREYALQSKCEHKKHFVFKREAVSKYFQNTPFILFILVIDFFGLRLIDCIIYKIQISIYSIMIYFITK
jgi:hypothetical protein